MPNITQKDIQRAQDAFEAARETVWRNREAWTLLTGSEKSLIKSLINAGMNQAAAQKDFQKHMKSHAKAYEESLDYMHHKLSELRNAIKEYNAQA